MINLSAIISFFNDLKLYFQDPDSDKTMKGSLSQYRGPKVQSFDWRAWYIRSRNLLLFACVTPLVEVFLSNMIHMPISGLRFGSAVCMGLGFAITYPFLATYGECFQGKGKRSSVHILDSFMWAGIFGIFPGFCLAFYLGDAFFAGFL